MSLASRVNSLSQPENIGSLKGIRRGIEREALRVTSDAKLATTPHPKSLGSPLTHSWITTDFAESMMEFITPADDDAKKSIEQLRDIHRYTYQNLENELLWPFSMPCKIENEDSIDLANYGSSKAGMLKTKYRLGLKRRYGSTMQIISGLHYNFSMPDTFWAAFQKIESDNQPTQDFISERYFGLIRNFLRLGWIIPYLFGASPAVDASFIKNSRSKLSLCPLGPENFYLPHATSLRVSDLGYTSALQDELSISYNSLSCFVRDLRHATNTSSKYLNEINQSSCREEHRPNINSLNEENELYAPIRPKRVAKNDEKLSEALQDRGVQYVEVRSLDVNPYVATGITPEQIRFLDVFLTYCLLKDSPKLSEEELRTARKNQKQVASHGRDLSLGLMDCTHSRTFLNWAEEIFSEMGNVAKMLDGNTHGNDHALALQAQIEKLHDPSVTPSARIIQDMMDQNVSADELAIALANKHRCTLLKSEYSQIKESDFIKERENSIVEQKALENPNGTGQSHFKPQKREILSPSSKLTSISTDKTNNSYSSASNSDCLSTPIYTSFLLGRL